MPHHLLAHHWRLALAAAAASFLLTLWALHLDPVINVDGILYVEAADYFARGQWTAGFAVYKWPFYSFVIGTVSALTGIATGQSAYLVNACLYALTVLGFVAFVKVLGGGNRLLWLAAVVALLHPVLNEFRSFVIRDVGYWACYLWSLAFFLAYVRHGRPYLLAAGAAVAFAAFLFRIEGIVLITILPACIYASRSADPRRTAGVLILAALVTAAAVAAAPLWQYVSQVNVSTPALLADPLQHVAGAWSLIGAGIDDRLQALQREFPGLGSAAAALPVYVLTVLAMSCIEAVKSVGFVFTGLIIYAIRAGRVYIPEQMRSWWWLVVGIQALLVLQFGLSNFFLAERYPLALALTLLPVVPFFLDDLWQRGTGRKADSKPFSSFFSLRRALTPFSLIAALIIVESVEGLDLSTEKRYLKDAGLWLRANAAPGSSVYSNSRILVYYSGLRESRSNREHTWDAAMREVWTDDWRRHDYFALVMTRANRQHEVLLFRQLDAQPVKTFANEDGDRVLIFRTG